MLKQSLSIIALASIAPWLYDRGLAVSDVLANRPGKLENLSLFKQHEVKFADRLRNCEDVLFEQDLGIAFVSCNPGRDQWNTVMGTFAPPLDGQDSAHIWLYDYSTPNLSDSRALRPLELLDYPNATDFQPLGIEFDAATSTLYLINHSRNSGNIVQLFQVSVRDATAKYLKTFTHGLVHTPNSMHSLGGGKLLVTNDHYIGALTSPLLSKLETFTSFPGGSIVYVDTHAPSHTKLLGRLGFANGITMLNATTVAVASTAKPAVHLYTLDYQTLTLHPTTYFRLPFFVDNLAVDSSGKLLMAGHPFSPALMVVSKARAKCDMRGGSDDDDDDDNKRACACTSPSWAAEWGPEQGVQTVYKNNGTEFCSSSTFARDAARKCSIVTGLYDRGLLVGRG